MVWEKKVWFGLEKGGEVRLDKRSCDVRFEKKRYSLGRGYEFRFGERRLC